MTSITLRPSTTDDAECISKCIESIANERLYSRSLQGFTVEETRSFFISLQQNGGIQLVAVTNDDDNIIGWCDINCMQWRGMTHVGTLGMGVIKSHRGQGVGRKLLKEVLQRIFSENNNIITRVELEVFSSNDAAIHLYKSQGFVEEGRKRRARLLDGVEDDILIMGLLRDEWTPTLSDEST